LTPRRTRLDAFGPFRTPPALLTGVQCTKPQGRREPRIFGLPAYHLGLSTGKSRSGRCRRRSACPPAGLCAFKPLTLERKRTRLALSRSIFDVGASSQTACTPRQSNTSVLDMTHAVNPRPLLQLTASEKFFLLSTLPVSEYVDQTPHASMPARPTAGHHETSVCECAKSAGTGWPERSSGEAGPSPPPRAKMSPQMRGHDDSHDAAQWTDQQRIMTYTERGQTYAALVCSGITSSELAAGQD
jgi:hypothetical protein